MTLEQINISIEKTEDAINSIVESQASNITLSNESGSQSVTHLRLEGLRKHLEWLENKKQEKESNTSGGAIRLSIDG